MKEWFRFQVLFLILVSLSACARTQKVVAIDDQATTPYESLGTLEVYTHANLIRPVNAATEIATLGFADTQSRADAYKAKLRKKLAKMADKRYHADAVVNVKYWPDPASKSFPDGRIYARGEMIQWKAFPEPNPEAAAMPSPQEIAPVAAS